MTKRIFAVNSPQNLINSAVDLLQFLNIFAVSLQQNLHNLQYFHRKNIKKLQYLHCKIVHLQKTKSKWSD